MGLLPAGVYIHKIYVQWAWHQYRWSYFYGGGKASFKCYLNSNSIQLSVSLIARGTLNMIRYGTAEYFPLYISCQLILYCAWPFYQWEAMLYYSFSPIPELPSQSANHTFLLPPAPATEPHQDVQQLNQALLTTKGRRLVFMSLH